MNCPYGYDESTKEVSHIYDTKREYELDEALMEIKRDNDAVDEFAKAMKQKLALARAKGRSGWNNKETCSDEHLAHLFREHLKKCNEGNFIDLANFLMFLHVREANPFVLSTFNCFACVYRNKDVQQEPCYSCNGVSGFISNVSNA